MISRLEVLRSLTLLFIKTFLMPIESLLLKGLAKEKNYPTPVFVIGPPRSGTTLLYQLLVQRFDFLYINNLVAKLYLIPVLGIYLSRLCAVFMPVTSVEYSSRYGQTKHFFEPNEAGDFWYRWFPKGMHVYVGAGVTTKQNIQSLRSQVAGLSCTSRSSILFKNTYNAMRIAPILEAFPNAVFLVLQRDPLDIAQSILEGRIKNNGNKHNWWSLPPKEINQIQQHDYWEQIPEQVYYIYQQIEADSRRYGEERFLSVSYRSLCEETHKEIERIQRFFIEHEVNVKLKGSVPASFPYSTGKKINTEEYEKLQAKVNELWKI